MDLQRIFRYGIGIAIVIVVAVLLISNMSGIFTRFSTNTGKTVKIEGATFQIDLAQSEKEKQLGLSDRSKLEQNKGMLFVFNQPDYYHFWMRNMNFPLDLIFIKDNTVVSVLKNVQPAGGNIPVEKIPSFTSSTPADKVLEINSGLADKHKITPGDKVSISL